MRVRWLTGPSRAPWQRSRWADVNAKRKWSLFAAAVCFAVAFYAWVRGRQFEMAADAEMHRREVREQMMRRPR